VLPLQAGLMSYALRAMKPFAVALTIKLPPSRTILATGVALILEGLIAEAQLGLEPTAGFIGTIVTISGLCVIAPFTAFLYSSKANRLQWHASLSADPKKRQAQLEAAISVGAIYGRGISVKDLPTPSEVLPASAQSL
jgi:hypothetical protein